MWDPEVEAKYFKTLSLVAAESFETVAEGHHAVIAAGRTERAKCALTRHKECFHYEASLKLDLGIF